MRILITGGKGFVGQHLTALLQEQGHHVQDFSYQSGGDLLNYESIRTALDVLRPDQVYHLAAQAYVPESFTSPKRAFEVNTIGSLNLLEAVRNLGIKTRLLLAGTSEEYGDAQYGDGFITEETSPNPLSPYAISKLSMDHLGRLYAKSYGMHVVVTRAFNHTGPGRGEMYAESSFAKQVAETEAGLRDIVEHGNLNSVRNYTDVRDMVRAYTQAISLPSDIYNICSDRSITMHDVLDTLCQLSDKPIPYRVNPALYRPADFSFKTPTCEKFKRLTDWEPHYTLETTLKDLLDYWRAECES